MATYKVALLAIISLAVVSLAVWLYWGSRPPSGLRNLSPPVVKPCKWLPNPASPRDADCEDKCPPGYEGTTQAPINGITYLFCCPKGYSVGVDHDDVKCYKNPH
jgi:hypothetical protein